MSNLCCMTIFAERVTLKPVSSSYEDALFRELTDEVARYLVFQPTGNIDDTRAFIARSREEMDKGTALKTVILDRVTGDFLGYANLRSIDTREPKIGIWLAKSAQRKGSGRKPFGRSRSGPIRTCRTIFFGIRSRRRIFRVENWSNHSEVSSFRKGYLRIPAVRRSKRWNIGSYRNGFDSGGFPVSHRLNEKRRARGNWYVVLLSASFTNPTGSSLFRGSDDGAGNRSRALRGRRARSGRVRSRRGGSTDRLVGGRRFLGRGVGLLLHFLFLVVPSREVFAFE